jgi:DNA-binding MarR family transcriptional regulator
MSKQVSEPFQLTDFFPYRLAVLSERVSMAVAQLYSDRFDVTRAEWRVLAALAVNNGMTAKEIIAYSTLEKMQVSRAVVSLEAKGHVVRSTDAADRRAQILTLTAAGRALFKKIVPLARAREADLLQDLDKEELALLASVMDKVLHRAQKLVERG